MNTLLIITIVLLIYLIRVITLVKRKIDKEYIKPHNLSITNNIQNNLILQNIRHDPNIKNKVVKQQWDIKECKGDNPKYPDSYLVTLITTYLFGEVIFDTFLGKNKLWYWYNEEDYFFMKPVIDDKLRFSIWLNWWSWYIKKYKCGISLIESKLEIKKEKKKKQQYISSGGYGTRMILGSLLRF
jgi:hypothetical protein